VEQVQLALKLQPPVSSGFDGAVVDLTSLRELFFLQRNQPPVDLLQLG
jgi:hypothetical protein